MSKTTSPRRRRFRLVPTRGTTPRADRMGAAMIEFAIVAPLMILFSLGLVEMGRMTMVKQIITNVSREGARLATLPGVTNQEVQAQVTQMLSDSNLEHPTVLVTPSSIASAPSGTFVSVTISVQAADVSWLPNPMFMSGKSVSARTSMRKESM